MKILRFIDSFIPENYERSGDDLRKARVLISTIWIIYAFTLNYAFTSYFIGFKPGMMVEGIASFWYLGLPFLFKKTGNIDLVANLCLTSATFCIIVVVYYAGGFDAPTLPWLAFPPLVSLMIASRKYAWLWFSIVLGATIVFWIMTLQGYEFPVAYNLKYKNIFKLICAAGLIAIMFLICYVFESAKTTALDKLGDTNNLLRKEISKSGDLLSNILPAPIIKELSEKGKTNARQYDSVTVMFADIEGFTSKTEKMNPEELIEMLDTYFREFDDIMEENGVEKIKTIGDAYLAAGGIPVAEDNNAQKVIKAAKACQEIVFKINKERVAAGKRIFEFRIGIHTGPLIAGVVGKKKYVYDIWGDTVNIAARMEQNSMKGKINISQNTYDRIREKVQCIHRGKIEAKNKGQLDMYFLTD